MKTLLLTLMLFSFTAKANDLIPLREKCAALTGHDFVSESTKSAFYDCFTHELDQAAKLNAMKISYKPGTESCPRGEIYDEDSDACRSIEDLARHAEKLVAEHKSTLKFPALSWRKDNCNGMNDATCIQLYNEKPQAQKAILNANRPAENTTQDSDASI